MTKSQLTTFIMGLSAEHKKTNLMKMHIADLEALAESLKNSEPTQTTLCEDEPLPHTPTPEIVESIPELESGCSVYDLASAAYDIHKKLVKGPRIDKDEFRHTAISKIIDALANCESSNADAVTVEVINNLLQNKTHFCPLNDTERLMLATIPVLDEFHGIDSAIDGKTFLQKVNELHGVATGTTRALMVSLCRKGFYEIKGVKSGQKRTTLHLMERGIQYLENAGLLARGV